MRLVARARPTHTCVPPPPAAAAAAAAAAFFCFSRSESFTWGQESRESEGSLLTRHSVAQCTTKVANSRALAAVWVAARVGRGCTALGRRRGEVWAGQVRVPCCEAASSPPPRAAPPPAVPGAQVTSLARPWLQDWRAAAACLRGSDCLSESDSDSVNPNCLKSPSRSLTPRGRWGQTRGQATRRRRTDHSRDRAALHRSIIPWPCASQTRPFWA